MITADTFRADWPVFQSLSDYPNPVVNFWIGVANLFLTNTWRWGIGADVATSPPTTMLDYATELFVAHNLVLERQAMRAASSGGAPGATKGPITSMSVNGVSVSYDVSAGIVPDAAQWNLTIYGIRFIQLVNMFGAGPIQVGIGEAPPFSGGGAWAGPIPYLGTGNWDN